MNLIKSLKFIARMSLDAIKVCGVLNLPKFFYDYIVIKKLIDKKIEPLQKYKKVNPGESYEKYLNLNYWVFETLLRVYNLGLNKGDRKLRILDIGTGMGYFPFICKYFGHSAEGVDLGDNELYDLSVSALRVHRYNQCVMAFTPLSITNRYDLITAFMICFNGHRTSELWHIGEWKYFLNTIHENNLTKNGEIFLSFNEELISEAPACRELLDFFSSHGAELSENTVKINSLVVLD